MKKLLLALALAGVAGLATANNCPNEMKAIDAKLATNPKLSDADAAKVKQLRAEGEAAHKAGKHLVEVSYLANKIRWRADYNVVLNAEDTKADVSGWVTIENNTGTSYEQATVKLLAGDPKVDLNQLPMGVVGVAIGTVLLPEMSAKIARNDEKGASIAQNRAIVIGLLLTLPCIAAFFIIPELLMRALFVRGNFGVDAADQAALSAAGGGPFGPAERPMGGYITLPPRMSDAEAQTWVGRSLAYVGTLPPRKKKSA